MKQFKTIAPEAITENLFQLIGKEWMLITAGNMQSYNMMTASWGLTGILWHRPMAVCFIRPHRHTFEFVNKSAYYTLSFFHAEYKPMLDYCGTHSGKNVDKTKETGLIPWETPLKNVAFEQAHLIIECKKIYSDTIKPEFFLDKSIEAVYPQKDYHTCFFGEIVQVYKS